MRVNSQAARSPAERGLLSSIDHHGPMSARDRHNYPMSGETGDIVVEASAPGFKPAQITIPTSTDAATAGVLPVAEAGAGQPVNFFP